MNLLNRLTIKNLKLNKKRSIVTIIGIMLSVALITAVSSMYASFLASSIKYETYKKGNYHVGFTDVDGSSVHTIRNNFKIKEVSLMKNLGYAKLAGSQNANKPYVYVKAYDTIALRNFVQRQLLEGRLPENEHEILIPEHVRKNGKVDIKIGDTLTLDIGKRMSAADEELNQNMQYDVGEEEKIVDTQTQTYTVVGKIARPDTVIEPYVAPGYTFVTLFNDTAKTAQSAGTFDVFALFTSKGVRDYLRVTANIIGVDELAMERSHTSYMTESPEHFDEIQKELQKAKYHYVYNQYLIDLQTNPLSISTMRGLGAIVGIVLAIIIFTSVFCIKNSFDISITEKTKQYGMLKSIGATKRQIRNNALFEAEILGGIGIPLGIVCGLIATFLLIWISNTLLGNIMAEDNTKLFFSISPLAILVAVLLGALTIYISAVRSSYRAAKVSPIESIKNSADIKIKRKSIQAPKIIERLFGVGGVIAYKNTKRNKKRYRTTIVSLTISIMTFIALFYFSDLFQISIKSEFGNVKENYRVTVKYTGQEEKIRQAVQLDDIREYAIYRATEFTFTGAKYSRDYQGENRDENTKQYSDKNVAVGLVAVGDAAYQSYLRELGLRQADVGDAAIMIDRISVQCTDKNGKLNSKITTKYDYHKGDVIDGEVTLLTEGQQGTQPLSIAIAAVTDKYPIGASNSGTYLVVSDTFLTEHNITIDTAALAFDAEHVETLEKEVNQIFGEDNIYIALNKEEEKKQSEDMLLLMNIFLYGFVLVISLIGVTNIFNTITTSMELRKPEFAMLKSIGMTKAEFNRMIYLESAFIGGKSLLAGTVLGSVLAYVMYHLNESNDPFAYLVVPVVISVIVVFLLITALMKYSIGKIQKQNTIETIRNENI